MRYKTFIYILFFLTVCKFSFAQNKLNSSINNCVNSFNVNADTYYSCQFDTIGMWYADPCGWGYNIGSEYILRFKPKCTNTYRIKINSYSYPYFVLSIRNSGSICDSTGFTCCPLTPSNISGTNYSYCDLLLDSALTYDFLVDYNWPYAQAAADIIIISPTLTNFEAHHITPDSITFSWNGTFDNVVIEYGIKGFTPGVDTVAGTGGTIINNALSPQTIFGLYQDSVYDFYYRRQCGVFASNSSKFRIKIPANCDSMPTIISGSNFTFTNYSSPLYFTASWVLANCGSSCLARSPEKILNFTPDSSGMYIIRKLSTGSTAPSYFGFYKEATYGCDEYNWNCAFAGGNSWMGGGVFGPLNALTPYYLLMKGTQDDCGYGGVTTAYFKLEGPSKCFAPVQPRIFNISTNSVYISPNCPYCTDSLYVEFGPTGFTPGTDSLPGPLGTVVHVAAVAQTIYGLPPGTSCQIYLRQHCDSVNEYSPNSNPAIFTTIAVCSNSPTVITSNAPNNTVCGPTNISLHATGGILSPTGNYVWTLDSCNGPVVYSGGSSADYYFFTATATHTYFVHAQDTCGNNACASITITVNPVPNVSIVPTGSITMCAGDTTYLTATTASSNTIQWYRNTLALNGDTTLNYAATYNGSYYAKVTNTLGCKKNSATAYVAVVCAPAPDDPPAARMIDNFTENTNFLNVTYDQQSHKIKIIGGGDKLARGYLYNSLGVLVKKIQLSTDDIMNTINTSGLSTGIYLLYVESNTINKSAYKINIIKQ